MSTAVIIALLRLEAHEREALAFFKAFPDQHLGNNPYKTMIAEGASADGEACEVRNRMTLCRCERSANKPFCDGSHAA